MHIYMLLVLFLWTTLTNMSCQHSVSETACVPITAAYPVPSRILYPPREKPDVSVSYQHRATIWKSSVIP